VVSDAEELVTSVRQAAAACNAMSPNGPEMDIAWLIPAPSWTIQRLIRLVRIKN
jgi:hypothetical protein